MNNLITQLKLVFVAMFLVVILNPFDNNAYASDTPAPSVVTLTGSFQDELGCPGDWQPDCVATSLVFDAEDNVWQRTFDIPTGDYEYKVTLNESWNESYPAENIPISVTTQSEIKFYYSHETHWITDNVNSVIATVPGSYQDEIGCLGDWQPDCLRSWLQDIGSGIYSFSTSDVSAGSHEAKVTINEDWDENYGAGGVQSGPNIPFIVPVSFSEITFVYDSVTHILDINIGAPPVPIYYCVGFGPPMNDFPVSFRGNHSIPLRAKLFDEEGFEVTALADPPIMEDMWTPNDASDILDVTIDALPGSQGDDGNQFYFTDSGFWQFILGTQDYKDHADGLYRIEMKSGDPSAYVIDIDPECVTEIEFDD